MKIDNVEFRDKDGNEINPTKEQMARDENYDKLIGDIKFKIMDLLDKVTDDYMEGFIESVDNEIANIKENKEFWQNQYYRIKYALSSACDEILKLQGYNKEANDYIDMKVSLENYFLENINVADDIEDERKTACNRIFELCEEKYRNTNEYDLTKVISRDELVEIIMQVANKE